MRNRSWRLALGMLAAASLLAVPAAAGADDELGTATEASGTYNESATSWFVQLAGMPAAKGGNVSALKSEHDAFRAAANAQKVAVTERYEYSALFNGFAVRVDPAKVAALRDIPGVVSVSPVHNLSLPPLSAAADGADPDLKNAIGMTGADIAQNELHLDGSGVKVAVMDSGLDYTLPEFGGSFPSAKVPVGWDFVGDSYDSNSANSTYQPVAHPDADPAPCDPNVADQRAAQPGAGVSDAAHGTHVAGIVAADGRGHQADGQVVGVAPGASLMPYRVFGCNGSTDEAVMVAAMERALGDGAQVLNMSVGDAFNNWAQSVTSTAASNLASAGVVVVASIGNSGANGIWSAGAPGVGSNVIGVASFDNVKVTGISFEVNGTTKYAYGRATGAPAPPTSGKFPLVATGTPVSAADACTALSAGSLAGKVVLVRRGTCTFYVKAKNVENAGAVGAVLYNNVAGVFNPTVAGTPAVGIPVVAVGKAAGEAIFARITSASTLEWTNEIGESVNDTGNLASDFTSYGTDAELGFKPDLGAPGGSIYSTWPHQQFNGHNSIGGTSMSSPHVAGAAALYLQAHPGSSWERVRTAFQNTAQPKVWFGNPALGLLEPSFRQGAGMLQVDKAIETPTSVTPSKIALGEGTGGTRTLTLVNSGDTAVTYTLSHTPTVSTGGSTFAPSFFTNAAGASFSASTVTVPAHGTATVDVTLSISEPATPADRRLFGGYVVLTAPGAYTLRVPYAGYRGDYQSIQAVTSGRCSLPTLAKFGAPTDAIACDTGVVPITGFTRQAGGASYTLTGTDFPVLLYHFDHQVRKLNIQVFKADGSAVHPVFDYVDRQEFLKRNSTATSFFGYVWDGMRSHDNGGGNGDHRRVVPNGRYVLKLSVLKAGGDEANPAHWETWTSPVITLARP